MAESEKLNLYTDNQFAQIDEEQFSKRAIQMVDSFNEWTNETEQGPSRRNSKLPGISSSLGTLQDDEVGSHYKKAFKGMVSYKDRMPYANKNSIVLQRPQVVPFKRDKRALIMGATVTLKNTSPEQKGRQRMAKYMKQRQQIPAY